jgi:hypothetical protein
VPLPNNAHIEGWRDAHAPMSRNVLAYYADGRLQAVTKPSELDGKSIETATCGANGARCTVTYSTGAHSTGVVSASLGERGIALTGDVVGGAPGAAAAFLDGDSHPDAVIRQSTYNPDYADAPQYWETYLERDGKFVRTGCTAPTKANLPAPTQPVHTACP